MAVKPCRIIGAWNRRKDDGRRTHMAFNMNDLASEQIQKSMACKSLEGFQAYVKDVDGN